MAGGRGGVGSLDHGWMEGAGRQRRSAVPKVASSGV